MGIDDYYSTGTIKVKNADGELVPFVPRTSTDNVYSEGEVSLSTTISEFNTRITEAAQKGGVKVMYEEPTAENTATFGNKTLIGYVIPETWEFTVDTRKLSSSNTYTGIPFNYFGMNGNAYYTGSYDSNFSIKVDWGDETTSTIKTSDISRSTASSYTQLFVHSYETPGVYNIKISSNDWDELYISTGTGYNFSITLDDSTRNIYYFIKTLVELTNSIPKVKGTLKPNYWQNDTNIRYWTRTNDTFYGMFCACTALAHISRNLFAKNTNITTFANCFYGCSSLTSIPTGLFDNNTAVTSFGYCFRECSSLTSIPTGLFDNNIAVTNFGSCFSGCSKITTIPLGLFDNNIAVTNFGSCFSGCSKITSVPAKLFNNNPSVTTFERCFSGCSSITSIPTDLFRYNTAVTSFSWCFYGCSKLTSIPTDLFRYNTAVIGFYNCFTNCSKLTSIPTDLFRYNTAVTDFSGCFYGCSKITSIPQDLFRYNTAVIKFGSCFRECTSLTLIPEDLFRYNVNVGLGTTDNTRTDNFNDCFYGCTSLTSIPEDLFRYNVSVRGFWETFCECSQLGGFSLRITSTDVQAATDFVTKKSGVTRTIYVPNNSATKTKFNNVASSLGLTIIGE